MLTQEETFISLFKNLRTSVKGSPSRLEWLAQQSPKVRRLAASLADTANAIERKIHGTSTRSVVAPSGFEQSWREYQTNFKEVVEPIRQAQSEREFKRFLEAIEKDAKNRNISLDDALEELLYQYRKPGSTFDPTNDNPAELFDVFLSCLEDYIEIIHEGDPPEEYDKALGAWHFFSETLDLNFQAIYSRWQNKPNLFIPLEATNQKPQQIIDLYNEAVRCYLFGNHIAAICMCRALLEHLLRRYYQLDGDDLEHLIDQLESQRFRFRKLRLQGRRKMANLILHNYEMTEKVDEEQVLQFLAALHELIKSSPLSSS